MLPPSHDAIDELISAVFADSGTGYRTWREIARPNQLPPPGDWRIWLILSGRGFGKSRAVNEWAIEQARLHPRSRGALVAATAGDARDVVVEGESGILNIAPPGFVPRYEPSKRRLTFPNGSMATTFSADEPNRLRGPQFHWAICDELAAWRFEATFDNLLMGLRLGRDPRLAISTTPRPIPLIRRLLNDPTCSITRGSTYENAANLAPAFLDAILSRYENTQLGRQEIDGQVLEVIDGALWRREWIEQHRVTHAPQLLPDALTNKLLHPPCAGLREAAAQGDAEMLNLIKNLYRLDGRNSCP